MTTISQSVRDLALYTSAGEAVGAPLLQQLRQAVWGDAGRKVSNASQVTSIPIDATAFTTWEDITGQIAAQFQGTTDLRPNPHPIPNLLGWHAAFTAAADEGNITSLMVQVAEERLEHWAEQIRGYFAAPTVWELSPLACPNCGRERARWGRNEAEIALWGRSELETESSAIAVTVVDGELVAACRNSDCTDVFGDRSTWKGRHEITELGRRTGIWVDMDAIQEALIPIPEAEYVPDTGKTYELFDPKKHADLLGGAA